MSSKTRTTGTMDDAKPALVPKLRFPEFRGAKGWDVELLGGICQPQQWTTISSTDLADEGYPVYGANGFIGYYSDFNHEFETVAVTCRGSTCGEVSLIPPKSYITGNSMCLDGIDAAQNSYHFLYHLLRHRGFSDVISGSAQPQIVGNAIKRLRIALPAKPEQQKIAECLSSVDELMAAQGRKVDALKTHKKGLMQQLFPREGETQPRLRFPEFQNTGEWSDATMGTLLMSSPDYGVNAAAVPFSEHLPKYLRITDISEDGHYLPEKQVSVDLEATDGNYLDEGDIVLTRTGASVGKSYRYRKEDGRLVFAGFLIRVKPHPKKLVSTYLANFLTTGQFWKWVAVNSARSGQPGINSTEYSSLTIPLPPTLTEQQRIASCLSSLDALITAETQKLEALKTHKKGLMQQLFPSMEAVAA